MANVLTDLAADIYKAADVVGRELVGFIPSSTINGDESQRVAVGDTVRSAFTQPATAVDVAPSMTIPEGTDQTVDNKTATISKSRAVQIPWTGEDMRHVNNGAGFETIYGDQLAQAMRTLTNEMETDLAIEAYRNASRVKGSAGTTPFASNYDIIPEVRKILVDNGCPTSDRQLTLVMDTAAGANLRKKANLQSVSDSGNDQLLRQGTLLDLQGIMIKESGNVALHTAGSITANVTVTGAESVGATEIGVTTDGTGAVSLVKGDVVTFAGGDDQYVVAADVTIGSSTTGVITIQEPGLRSALAGSEAVAAEASYTGNVVFHRRALELIVRPPAVPSGGDQADDAMVIQDPWSGIPFEVRVYRGYKKAMFEVAVAYGYKCWLPKFVAGLQG
jgi:hypothetical protein